MIIKKIEMRKFQGDREGVYVAHIVCDLTGTNTKIGGSIMIRPAEVAEQLAISEDAVRKMASYLQAEVNQSLLSVGEAYRKTVRDALDE